MNSLRTLVVGFTLLLSLTLSGCLAFSGVEVSHAFGPGVPLDGFGPTFAWAPGPRKPAGDAILDNPSLHEFTMRTLEDALAKKGYEKATRSPDMIVNYGFGRAITFEKAYPGVRRVDQGSLVVVCVDPTTRQMMWEGIAQANINTQMSPEDRKKRLEAGIRSMLETLPKPK